MITSSFLFCTPSGYCRDNGYSCFLDSDTTTYPYSWPGDSHANFSYKGKFNKNGEPHGPGILTSSNSNNRFEGTFVNGEPIKGTYTYDFGMIYTGDFKNGYRHGNGKATYSGTEYILEYNGEWANNYENGQGIIIFIDGDRYEGEFLNGMYHGKGKLKIQEKDKYRINYDGDWANGKKHGKGIHVNKDGSQSEVEFENDILRKIHRISPIKENTNNNENFDKCLIS